MLIFLKQLENCWVDDISLLVNFPNLKVIPVCEGYTQIVDGDLIVCTTHQLYRYIQSFDLLIIDEPDAYPYVGNDVLQAIVLNSCFYPPFPG